MSSFTETGLAAALFVSTWPLTSRFPNLSAAAWSIVDLLPMVFEENPDNLYKMNFVAINDVCDASSIPYDVDVDFTLPFHGELVHLNEIDMTVYKNDNPGRIPGHVDKSEVVSSSFQPLWDGNNILRGGSSKMFFSSSAILKSLEGAGELATNMMNEVRSDRRERKVTNTTVHGDFTR